ncbi:MAG TPA: phenylacetate--CoA ligase family protein, partial [Ktedonobacterales bacterium]|nr:phenylacetate--CoA ligase family protein [Ktedonobacterales bacterium]
MAYSTYWNPKNETLPREDLNRLQLYKLQRLAELAYTKSPFHRARLDAAGFRPEQLRTLDDLRRLPYMTREEWMASISETPHFGNLPTTDAAHAIRYHL